MDLAPSLARYFESLDRFDLDEVIGCFSEDVFYSRPAARFFATSRFNPGGGPRVEVHGRAALRELLSERGPRPTLVHRLTAGATDGDVAFAAGQDLDDGVCTASFVCNVVLDDLGLIQRYVAYASNPPVPEPSSPA